MNQKLTINGVAVDMGNEVISLTKQEYSLSDLMKRKIDRSNSIELPKSQLNVKIFKDPDIIASGNNSFDIFYNAKLFDNEVVILAGVAILEETNNTFRLQLLDASKNFYEVTTEKLNKLDFESDDFTFSLLNYGLLSVPTNSVWIWPVVNNHVQRNAKNTALVTSPAGDKTKYSRPSLRVDKLIDKIAAKHGWIFDKTNEYDVTEKGFITTNHKQFYVTSYQKTLNTTITPTTKTYLTGLNVNDFENNVTTTINSIDIGNITTILRLRGDVKITGAIKITFEGTSSPLGNDVQFQEYILREEETEIDISTKEFSTDENTNDIQIAIEQVEAGSSIVFEDTLLYTIIEEMDLGAPSTNSLVGYRVKVYDNMPDLTQLEFLRQEWTIPGVFFETNTFAKKFITYAYERLSKFNYVNWSSKFLQETEVISGSFSTYAQKNYLRYTGDELNDEKTGEGIIEVNNKTLNAEKTVVQLKYSPSNDIILNNYSMLEYPIYNNDERVATAGIRRGLWYYDTGSTFTIGKFQNVSWDELLEDFYKGISRSLSRIRAIEAEFSFSRLDVLGFDFKKLVYIEYFKSYFIVLEISDYLAGKPTKVKLLKYM